MVITGQLGKTADDFQLAVGDVVRTSGLTPAIIFFSFVISERE